MKKPTGPRIVRRSARGRVFSPSTLRKAKPALMRDFKGRCAYSMQHWKRAGGKTCMEIDHFDPRTKSEPIQHYENLMLATRHCNRAKVDIWPTETEEKAGIRFLNPCMEPDYGVHMVEDQVTGKLIPLTPAGTFQIYMCDLNAPHLMIERQQRTRIIAALHTRSPGSGSAPAEEAAMRQILREELRSMIPKILLRDATSVGS